LNEGYGPGAWHGADLKAALSDVAPEVAFWRPGAGRHNIAEIALHHAYCTRGVRSQIAGGAAEAFVLPGEDWFDLADEKTLSWPKILETVDREQERLRLLVAEVEAGKATSPVVDAERFKLVLGITCHAIYHAGQVQLIKRLRAG
jgi:hypothetical protein